MASTHDIPDHHKSVFTPGSLWGGGKDTCEHVSHL